MIEIVLCTDDNYVMPTGVLMQSIGKNCKYSNIHFIIISCEGLKESTKDSFIKIVNQFGNTIDFYCYDLNKISLPVGLNGQLEHLTITAYMRLFIPEILPLSIKKVLYIDCDIICRHDLSDLWNTDISGYALACAKDGCSTWLWHNTIQLEKQYSYYNSGVLLMNLDYWRNNNVRNRCLEYISNFPERCVNCDQDAINAVLKDEIKEIPRKYNCVSTLLYIDISNYHWSEIPEIQEAINDPVLVHYTGCPKPWNTYSNHTFTRLFRNYQSQTEWKDQYLDKSPISKSRRILHSVKSAIKGVFGIEDKNPFPPTSIQW